MLKLTDLKKMFAQGDLQSQLSEQQETLLRALTGFIRNVPHKEDRTLALFLDYLVSCRNESGLPQDVAQAVDHLILPLRESLKAVSMKELPLPEDALDFEDIYYELPFFPFPSALATVLDSPDHPSKHQSTMFGFMTGLFQPMLEAADVLRDGGGNPRYDQYFESRLYMMEALLPKGMRLEDLDPRVQQMLYYVLYFNLTSMQMILHPMDSKNAGQDPDKVNTVSVRNWEIEPDLARLLTAFITAYPEMKMRSVRNFLNTLIAYGQEPDTPLSIVRSAAVVENMKRDIVWLIKHPNAGPTDLENHKSGRDDE